MYACLHSAEPDDALVDCASAFSPRVERTGPATVLLDIHGLDRLYGAPASLALALARRLQDLGISASVAIAANPDAAVHAASGFPGVTVIDPGSEAERLGPLPLELLAPPPAMIEIFDRWGIRTFRDLAALPERGVSERLGEAGIRLQQLARGAGSRLLRPLSEEPVFAESLELEHPVELLEPLLFLLARLLDTLCARLAARGLAAIELRLTLRLETNTPHERALRLPVPMREARVFLKLLQLDLEATPPSAPVVALHLEAAPARPRVLQGGFFAPAAPEPEKLELTLARLAGVVGDANVGSAELEDTHRPGAFHMSRFALPREAPPARRNKREKNTETPPPRAALRVFRPPRKARVSLEGGEPVHVSAEGINGAVTAVAGPWRTAGDWWTPHAWARDEWDVALSDGGLYRICFEPDRARWYVEGSYD